VVIGQNAQKSLKGMETIYYHGVQLFDLCQNAQKSLKGMEAGASTCFAECPEIPEKDS
jgi:hypothetical protein